MLATTVAHLHAGSAGAAAGGMAHEGELVWGLQQAAETAVSFAKQHSGGASSAEPQRDFSFGDSNRCAAGPPQTREHNPPGAAPTDKSDSPLLMQEAPGVLDRVEKSRLFNDLKPGSVVTVFSHAALRAPGVPEQATVITAPVHPRTWVTLHLIEQDRDIKARTSQIQLGTSLPASPHAAGLAADTLHSQPGAAHDAAAGEGGQPATRTRPRPKPGYYDDSAPLRVESHSGTRKRAMRKSSGDTPPSKAVAPVPSQQSGPARYTAPCHLTFAHFQSYVLPRLAQYPLARLFVEPADPAFLNEFHDPKARDAAAMLLTSIRAGQCLSLTQICAKIRAGHYHTAEEIQFDLRRMFAYCYTSLSYSETFRNLILLFEVELDKIIEHSVEFEAEALVAPAGGPVSSMHSGLYGYPPVSLDHFDDPHAIFQYLHQ